MNQKNNKKQQSLKKTLNTQIGWVIFSVGVAVGILFFLFSVRLEKNDFKNNMQLQTKHLSDTFTQQLWLFDLNATEQLGNLAIDSPSIAGIRLMDHNRQLVVNNGTFSHPSAFKVEKELWHDETTRVGYIEIAFVNTSWRKHQGVILAAGVSMMAIIILASLVLISNVLKRHLAGPFNVLEKDMMAITSGQFKQSKIKGQKSEIQNIVDGFNRMAATLAEREAAQAMVEAQLSEEKRFIETLIQTLPGLFYVFEEGERLVRWNTNFEVLSGWDAGQMLNKHPLEWVGENNRAEMETFFKRVLSKQDASVELDLEFKKGKIPFFLTARHFSQKDKNYVLGMGINLTKRKELEKALRQAHKMESIGTLAGGIAHDFNNILFPLLGYTEMLQDDLISGTRGRDAADEIFKAALRARDLVRQILTLSRQSDQELKPLRIQSILKEAVKLLGASIPRTIEIRTDIDRHCDLVVADPTQIHQIIMNLATNAYHAMQENGGVLSFGLKQIKIEKQPVSILDLDPGEYVMLSVNDSGTGMEKEILDKIFDPYFSTKKQGKGTGLGLSVVQGIVKRCKGEITVYSEPGQGTEFHVYLPVIEKSNDIIVQRDETPIQTGSEHILLVDDDPAIVDMATHMLERLGYQVSGIVGSKAAEIAFKKAPESFDLILTDMTMPDMTGLQLADKVRAFKPKIPVVICTGFSDKISADTCKDFNIQGYISKPMVKNEMARVLRDALDGNNA